MPSKTFVGYGFGAIQSGLFALEAYRSGNFDRLVVADIDQNIVGAIRQSSGICRINVAEADCIRVDTIDGLEIYNPLVDEDRDHLVAAIAESDELSTALPSVAFYGRGQPSPAEVLASGLARRLDDAHPSPTIIYAAENHNHAAELLRDEVGQHLTGTQGGRLDQHVQFVNTVIGKMSGIVTDAEEIQQHALAPMVDGWSTAFRVEAFNRILITRIALDGFQRGIEVFAEKPDLFPFEEAKLYGHNATHALLGFLAQRKGIQFMSDTADSSLLEYARSAFLDEAGGALVMRHAGIDPLFTAEGWDQYATDLLQRMTNPYLRDRVDRVIRDPARKLGWDDRLVGTMRLAMAANIHPRRYALGAAAALELVMKERPGESAEEILHVLWGAQKDRQQQESALYESIAEARRQLT